MTKDQEVLARKMWDDTPMTGEQIGAEFGVSRNVIIGLANKRGWTRRRDSSEPRSLDDRLDALHVQLDAVLAETRVRS